MKDYGGGSMKIKAYTINSIFRNQLRRNQDLYPIDSEVDRSVVYVVGNREIAIADGKTAVRIPEKLLDELLDIRETLRR